MPITDSACDFHWINVVSRNWNGYEYSFVMMAKWCVIFNLSSETFLCGSISSLCACNVSEGTFVNLMKEHPIVNFFIHTMCKKQKSTQHLFQKTALYWRKAQLITTRITKDVWTPWKLAFKELLSLPKPVFRYQLSRTRHNAVKCLPVFDEATIL